MFELLVAPEPFLKENFYVWFSPGWDTQGRYAEKFFEVELTQQIPFDVYGIINVGETWDIAFQDQGLIPENPLTLYEILIGLKGNVLLYPRLPSTDWYLKLEKAGFVPDPANDVKRYIGCYVEADMPYDQPKLRAYCIKDMEPPVLRLRNDSIEAEKAVVRFLVNRCKLKAVDAETERKLKAKQLPYRVIKHYSLFKY